MSKRQIESLKKVTISSPGQSQSPPSAQQPRRKRQAAFSEDMSGFESQARQEQGTPLAHRNRGLTFDGADTYAPADQIGTPTKDENEGPTFTVRKISGIKRRTSVRWGEIARAKSQGSSSVLTRHKSFDDVLRRPWDGDEGIQRSRSLAVTPAWEMSVSRCVSAVSFASETVQIEASFDSEQPGSEAAFSFPDAEDSEAEAAAVRNTLLLPDEALTPPPKPGGLPAWSPAAKSRLSRSASVVGLDDSFGEFELGLSTPPAKFSGGAPRTPTTAFSSRRPSARSENWFGAASHPLTRFSGLSFESPFTTPRHATAKSPTPPERPGRGLGPQVDFFSAGGEDNDCRFEREFDERQRIGEGNFSVVFKARNTVDRCYYAVKRTKQRILARGETPTDKQVKEAFALATMEKGDPSPNIVRYYCSWFESGQLFIQMELCESSLRGHMKALCVSQTDARFTASEMVEIVSQVTNGLDRMHQSNFVHLDIKPDNIMRGNTGRWKIGDLGLAEMSLKGDLEICEGDCRYLAREVLKGDIARLSAADVFSLGLMAFELGTNPLELPCGGDEWHRLRDGFLNYELLPSMPPALWELLQALVKPDPEDRPTCAEILKHPGVKARKEVLQETLMRQQELEDLKGSSEVERLIAKLKDAEAMAAYYKQEADNFRRQVASQASVMRRTSSIRSGQAEETEPAELGGVAPPPRKSSLARRNTVI